MKIPLTHERSNKWLRRETLELKRIINLASGMHINHWPPDNDFIGLFRDLLAAIGLKELRASRHPNPKFHAVPLDDLRDFVSNRDSRWEPIRELCRVWAEYQKDDFTDRPARQVDKAAHATDNTKSPRKKPAAADHDRWVATAKELKRKHPGWGPSRIAQSVFRAEKGGTERTSGSKERDPETIRRVLTERRLEWNPSAV